MPGLLTREFIYNNRIQAGALEHMNLYKCPDCNHPGGKFESFPSKEKYKWYEISQKRFSCRHCGAQVALDRGFQKWGLLALPAIVVSVWDLALANQGGVNQVAVYFLGDWLDWV